MRDGAVRDDGSGGSARWHGAAGPELGQDFAAGQGRPLWLVATPGVHLAAPVLEGLAIDLAVEVRVAHVF